VYLTSGTLLLMCSWDSHCLIGVQCLSCKLSIGRHSRSEMSAALGKQLNESVVMSEVLARGSFLNQNCNCFPWFIFGIFTYQDIIMEYLICLMNICIPKVVNAVTPSVHIKVLTHSLTFEFKSLKSRVNFLK
jgi:hypothetical protein